MEWKYPDKFVDRSPTQRAAGAPLAKSDKINDCLNIHTVDDAVETVLNEAGLHKVPLDVPLQRLQTSRNPGVFTQIRELTRPAVETNYQTLLKDLRETTWESHWMKELGRSHDPIGGLPPNVTPDTVFGRPTPRGFTMKEMINPPITPLELELNEDEFHHMYRRTHNNYYPKEQCHRKYDSEDDNPEPPTDVTDSISYGPPFDPKKCFGKRPMRAANIETCIKWFNREPIKVANELLANYIDRTHFRNGNINSVAPGHRFGVRTNPDYYSVPELIQPNAANCNIRKDFRMWLSSLNEVRMMYKKRNVDFREIYGQCKYADANLTDWIPIATFSEILIRNKLSFPHCEIIPLAICFNICKEDMVHYELMLNLLNIAIPLPDLKRIDENCRRGNDFRTAYQLHFCNPVMGQSTKETPPAGLPSMRFDLTWIPPAAGNTKTDTESLGSETTVAALINPSVLTNYGLNQFDLKLPRDAAFIKTLFSRLGYAFPNDVFERLWEIGQRIEQQDKVSVETFRKLIAEAAPITVKDIPLEKFVPQAVEGSSRNKCVTSS